MREVKLKKQEGVEIEEDGITPQVDPARTQTVIEDKLVQKEGSWLHPTSCAFSRVFIPETENKWQELKCQDVLRDFLNLLLNPRA